MRFHAPEIEDESWCPALLRDGLTDFLQMASETMRIYDGATPVVAELMRRHQTSRIVDLCSGGGGPVLRLLSQLTAQPDLAAASAALTDLYPNVGAFGVAQKRGAGRVEPRFDGIDAAAVPDDLVGVRTIFNGFHHLRPALARRVVEDAARKRQPFVSIELVERRILTVVMVLGTPLAVLVLTPFSRSLSPMRMALTYLLPVIPLAVLWDGLMSCLRSYSVDELNAIVDGLSDASYGFRIEHTPVSWLPGRLTMLIGEPR